MKSSPTVSSVSATVWDLLFRHYFKLMFSTFTMLRIRNTYSDTASPTAATLTNRGNMTETLNTLLDNDNNTAALDIEFGMNGDSFLTQAAVGVDFSNLRINNSYSQTVTVYNDAAGVNDTVRDTETITSNTGAVLLHRCCYRFVWNELQYPPCTFQP